MIILELAVANNACVFLRCIDSQTELVAVLRPAWYSEKEVRFRLC